MTFKEHKASDLFNIKNYHQQVFQKSKKQSNRIEKCQFPFNIFFKKNPKYPQVNGKDLFKGPGIYLIEFKDKIIYIGKFKPFKKGDVISIRWKKHIETITNRGIHVGGFEKVDAKKTKQKKIDILKNILGSKFDLLNIVPEGRRRDTGTVTSVNRLNFAKNNWTDFKILNEAILNNFSFYYYQLDTESFLNCYKPKEFFEDLASMIEEYLLIKYTTACNSGVTEKIKIGNIKDAVSIIEKDIKDFIQ